MRTMLTALLLAAVLAVSTPAFAHHGNAAYEGTLTVLKDATVTGVAWANPHTIVQFDVKNEANQQLRTFLSQLSQLRLCLAGLLG